MIYGRYSANDTFTFNVEGKIIDIRGQVLVEVKKDSRPYYFYMPAGAPYQDAIQAAHMVADDIAELHRIALEKQKEREKEEKPEDKKE